MGIDVRTPLTYDEAYLDEDDGTFTHPFEVPEIVPAAFAAELELKLMRRTEQARRFLKELLALRRSRRG